MDNSEPRRWALWLSFPLAALLAAASLAGLFVTSTYANETRLHAAQAAGVDAMDLGVIVPVLAITAILARRGSVAAQLLWMGTLIYLVYNFLYYAFALHFNAMFLVYCGVLGLSFYALAGSIPALPIPEIGRRYAPRTPVKTTAIVLLVTGVGAAFHWLSEIVPALLAGRTPQAVRDSGLATAPVAVLDLALLAPASIAAAILLLRRKPVGFVFGPVLLAFLVLSGVGLAAMGTAMALRGFKTGYGLFGVASGIALGCAVLLVLSLRRCTAV